MTESQQLIPAIPTRLNSILLVEIQSYLVTWNLSNWDSFKWDLASKDSVTPVTDQYIYAVGILVLFKKRVLCIF